MSRLFDLVAYLKDNFFLQNIHFGLEKCLELYWER